MAVSWVEEVTVQVVETPLKLTLAPGMKFVPKIVTLPPTEPLVGVKEVIVGAPVPVSTRKLLLLVMTPPGVVTLIGPLVAPAGTVTVICVLEFTVKVVAFTPLKLTALAPVKPLPVSVTVFPANPYSGLNPNTVKFAALVAVPPEVVIVMGPVVAPAGTVAVICVSELID